MDQHEFNAKYESLQPSPKTVLRCFLLGLNDEKIARLRVLLEYEEIMFLLSILNKHQVYSLFLDKNDAQAVYDRINNENLISRLLELRSLKLNDQLGEEIIKKGRNNVKRNLLNAAHHFEISGDYFREELLLLFLKYKPEIVEFEALTNGNFDLRYLWTPDVRDFILEEETLNAIRKNASLVRIKSPYKMGKAFLVNKLLTRIQRHQNYSIISYDFHHSQQQTLANYEQLIKDLCRKFIRDLQLPDDLTRLDAWQDFLVPNLNITEYFEQYFLASTDELILVLYNCDIVFEKEYQQDFCTLLRSWFDKARMHHHDISQLWQKLHIILTHSTDVYANLDINYSPLANIGSSIELKPWTDRQVKELSQQYLLNLNQQDIDQLYQWLNGHPYLTTLVFQYLKQHPHQISQAILNHYHLSSICANHLQRLLELLKEILKSYPDLIDAYKRVLNSSATIKLEIGETWKLYSLGLTQINDQGNSHCFCQLYRRYFQKNL